MGPTSGTSKKNQCVIHRVDIMNLKWNMRYKYVFIKLLVMVALRALFVLTCVRKNPFTSTRAFCTTSSLYQNLTLRVSKLYIFYSDVKIAIAWQRHLAKAKWICQLFCRVRLSERHATPGGPVARWRPWRHAASPRHTPIDYTFCNTPRVLFQLL